MDKPLLYRKRYIPLEVKSLNDDEILFADDEIIVTKKDFSNGISCTFINDGYKISKFMNENGELVYYYCDIIKSEYQKDENIWIFTDLLADVKIYPNGATEVVDLGELSQAYRKNLISTEIVMEALEKLDKLLNLVYSGKWKDLTDRYFK